MKESNNNESKNSFFGNIKTSFSGRKFRSGAYVTLVSTVVIVIILVANMLFSKMNLQMDLSNQGMYTLTKDTTKMLSKLDDNITIYYMVKSGNEESYFKNIVKEYDAASNKITVVKKDPVLYPQFPKKLNIDDTVQENSFIVYDNTNKRAKYVDYNDMLVQETDQTTYQSKVTGIDVEGELTAAIQYVTTKTLPKMYVVEGHGESAIGDTFTASIKKMNVEVKSLTTMTSKSIPKDCNILLINAPTTDFSADETKMVKDYLAAGGKAIITVSYSTDKMKNFNSILSYYGIEKVNGVVLEGDSNMHMNNYPNYIVPNISSHDITNLASGKSVPVLMINCSGLKISDTLRSTLKVEPLLTTSDSAYSKVDLQSQTSEKEDGDIAGPFNLGVVATDTYDNKTTNLVAFASPYTFAEDTATYGNSELLTGTIGYLVGDTKMVSIPTKSLQGSMITTTEQQAFMLAGLVIGIIPICILIIGGIVCYRRRRK